MNHAQWNRHEFSPDPLVQQLEDLRKPDGGNGDVVFEGNLLFDDMVSVLERATIFSEILPELEKRRIVSEALSSAARSGPLTADSMIGEINRGAKEFSERPKTKYVLVTSLSIRYFPELTDNIEVFGCEISLGRQLPERLRSGHETAKERTRKYVFGDYPDQSMFRHYTAAWIAISARSEYEATTNALAALDLLRGVWNLALNRRRWSRTTSQRRKPVNHVLLGPIHSLHSSDGNLASEVSWYEYDYVEPTQSDEVKKRWEMVKGNEEGVWRCLNINQYRPEMEEVIRRYSRALDTREWDAAFVQLWGLLEDLTGTEPGESHENTIKRAVFLYAESERDLHFQVLKHLKDYRNRSVHGGEGSSDIEFYLFQLKRYVEEVLEYHLRRGHDYSSIKEMSRFLDQPADLEAVERKITALEKHVESKKAEIERAEDARKFHSDP